MQACHILKSLYHVYLQLVYKNPKEKFQNTFYKEQWEEQSKQFWGEQVDVLLKIIGKYKSPIHILDFGAGSGGLTEELRRRGKNVTALEPMFHGYLKDQQYPEPFDVVVAVEVIEHLPNLWEELDEIDKVMTSDGIFIVTTNLTNPFIDRPDAVEQFRSWCYKDDPTHVNFFSNRSLDFIAERKNWTIDVYKDQLFVARKSPSPSAG